MDSMDNKRDWIWYGLLSMVVGYSSLDEYGKWAGDGGMAGLDGMDGLHGLDGFVGSPW